jgi:hypothetical protein
MLILASCNIRLFLEKAINMECKLGGMVMDYSKQYTSVGNNMVME